MEIKIKSSLARDKVTSSAFLVSVYTRKSYGAFKYTTTVLLVIRYKKYFALEQCSSGIALKLRLRLLLANMTKPSYFALKIQCLGRIYP